jgi:hypothetical protein
MTRKILDIDRKIILAQFMCVTVDGIWIGELDLLTTCIHHLELHFTGH